MSDSIDPLEIQAYVDGELDLAQRLTVEEHLARNPAMAARVMADFRDRTALRLLAGRDMPPSPTLADIARRLDRARPVFFWRPPAGRVMAGALAALLGGAALLWSAQTGEGTPPSYVDLAVASHLSTEDGAEQAAYQPASDRSRALLSASRIVVPSLPSDWRIVGVEMVRPSAHPALLLSVRTAEGPILSLLAIRVRSSAPKAPDTVRDGGRSVAYWRKGDMSYALTGKVDPRQLDAKADALAASWEA
jgi:anti-sigma factor RsiW